MCPNRDCENRCKYIIIYPIIKYFSRFCLFAAYKLNTFKAILAAAIASASA